MKTKILTAALLVLALGKPGWAKNEADASGSGNSDGNSGSAAREQDKRPIHIEGFRGDDNKEYDAVVTEKDGRVRAVVTPTNCSDGTSCARLVPLDTHRITDPISDIESALRKYLADEKTKDSRRSRYTNRDRRESRDDRRSNQKELKEFREDFRDELKDFLQSECRIDLTKIKKDARSGQEALNKALAGTRFAQVELPKDNNDATCAGEKLKQFMADKAEDFESMEVDEESLGDLREDIRILRADLRDEDDPKKKDDIRREIADKEDELKSIRKEVDAHNRLVQAANTETSEVVTEYLMKAAVLDVAASPDAKFSYLHELASSTPEAFDGVRKAAQNALLSVYKTQGQTQMAYREAAARTTDPTLRNEWNQQSQTYRDYGIGYNSRMLDPGTRTHMYNNAYQQHLKTIAVNPDRPAPDEVRAAQDYANNVVKETLAAYEPGARQITNYLTGLGTTSSGLGSSTIPSVLGDGLVAGTISTGAVNGGRVRGARLAPAAGQVVRPSIPAVLPPR